VFKGPGFYVTDSRTEVDPELEHRKKEKEAAEKAEKGETSPEVKKPEPVPESKSKGGQSGIPEQKMTIYPSR